MDIDLYKQRKKELKMTFDDLAAKTNISKRTLIELFNNKRSNPTNNTIRAVERALGIGWTEEEYAAGIVPTVVRNVTPEEDDLLQAFRDLGAKKGEHAQALALKMIEEMINL